MNKKDKKTQILFVVLTIFYSFIMFVMFYIFTPGKIPDSFRSYLWNIRFIYVL